MKIELAPTDGIERYEKEISVIYAALESVTGEDFSGALVTNESHITDFLVWGDRIKRNQQKNALEQILGLPLDNPNLLHMCRMLHIKANT